jgi:hypothetical protein
MKVQLQQVNVIDALRVYANVATIGDPTYGKFVGSNYII